MLLHKKEESLASWPNHFLKQHMCTLSSMTDSVQFPDEDDSVHSSDEESEAGDSVDPGPDVEIPADVALLREAIDRAAI